MREDVNQTEAIVACAILFLVRGAKLTMITDSGKLHSILWSTTYEYLKFYTKLEVKDLIYSSKII